MLRLTLIAAAIVIASLWGMRAKREYLKRSWQNAINHYDRSTLLAFSQNDAIDVNDHLPGGPSALTRAAQAGDVELIKVLLVHHADVNVRTREGRTPLHFAAEKGNAQSAKSLIEHGAQVDATADNGVTPLLAACAVGNCQTASVLLDHGAKVDSRTNYGITPLYFAAQGGNEATVQLLLEKGADPNPSRGEYNTYVITAASSYSGTIGGIRKPTPGMVKDLLSHGAKIGLYEAALIGDLSRVKNLITQYKKDGRLSTDGPNALGAARSRGYAQVVEALAAAGVKSEASGRD